MAQTPESNTESQLDGMRKANVSIAGIFRNLPEEKCLELRTEQGYAFYYQSKFDPESGATIDTVYSTGRPPQSLQCLTKGNQTTEVMQTLFRLLPANVPKPDFQ